MKERNEKLSTSLTIKEYIELEMKSNVGFHHCLFNSGHKWIRNKM